MQQAAALFGLQNVGTRRGWELGTPVTRPEKSAWPEKEDFPYSTSETLVESTLKNPIHFDSFKNPTQSTV